MGLMKYKVLGKGYPVLLIHGFGIDFYIWNKLTPLLAKKGFQIVMIKLPSVYALDLDTKAYLDLCIDKIEGLRKQLGIKTWHIISYSLGCIVLEHYKIKFKDTINKSISIFPPYQSGFRRLLLKIYIQLGRRVTILLYLVLKSPLLLLFIWILGFNFKFNKQILVWYRFIRLENTSTMLCWLRCVTFFKFISPPNSLVICGTRDLAVSKMSSHKKTIFINCGHNGITENYVELATPLFKALGCKKIKHNT